MKRILFVFFISLALLACSDELYEEPSVEGVWKLTAYNAEDGFDINNDGIKSTNLLEEIECTNNETLVFEATGIMSSNSTFNPVIQIALLDGDNSNDYAFNVACDLEGVIGFATSYTQKGETITYNNHSAAIIDNQLYIVFEDAIEIYNADYSGVIKKLDLTLIYTKEANTL